MGVLDDVEKLEKSEAGAIPILKNIENNQQKIMKLLEEILNELKKEQ